MAIKVQGSELYALIPQAGSPGTMTVLEIGCVTAFNPGGSPAEQIEITCLSDTERRYMRGLRTPGQMSMSINVDPQDPSHMRLYELSQDDDLDDLTFAVGWSDGKGIAPTVSVEGDDFELPEGRTWYVFKGYVADFPFDFAANAAVTSEVSVQRSGGGAWIKKAA